MTDQRWSREDKRGVKRQVEEKEMFRDSSINRVLPRPAHETRAAAAFFAFLVIGNGYGREEVEETLSILGLDREALEMVKERQEPCWPYGGTSRGLNIHLKSYTYPCEPCKLVRDERRASCARRLEISHEGTIA